ncbi:hypothetical protein NDGK_01902 [Clostridiales bacterium CHKCI001]|nr:hypothetical protein NDGK_01902 [Clostridiales bacterium CHKCI001]
MKKQAKWLLLLLISVMVMLVTGCGGEVRTSSETEVDANWTGTRTITARFSRSTFNREADTTIKSLDRLIQAECPSQLEWERVLKSGYYEYSFKLSFTSMEDYKQKVDAIVGEAGHVIIETVDTLYEEQTVLREDIEPSDLLIWLKKAIAKKENESLANVEKLFRDYSNELVCNGEEVKLEDDDYLSYSNDRHVEFKGIDFITDITQDNLFNRTIEIRMLLNVSEAKQAQIREEFAARLPAGATSTWGEKENQTFYQATMQNMTPQQLSEFTNAVMDCQTNGMESVSTSDGMFQFKQEFQENVDLSSYFVADVHELPFLYYAKASDGISFVSSEKDKKQMDNESADVEQNNNNPEFPYAENGYQILLDDNIDKIDITFLFDNSYEVSSIDITTDVGWNNKFERTIVLNYDRVPLQKEQESIKTTMQEEAQGLSSIDLQTQENQFGVVVKQSGTADEITKAFQTIFNSDSYVSYEQDYTGMLRFAMPYQFEEKLYFDQFFVNGEEPEIVYHTNFLNGERVQEDDILSGRVTANGKGYEESSQGLSVEVAVVTTQQSYLPIFLIVLGILIIGTVLLLIIRWVRNKAKKKKEIHSFPAELKTTEAFSNDKLDKVIEESNEQPIEGNSNLEKNITETASDSWNKRDANWNAWKPLVKQSPVITEPNEIAAVREEKKMVDIPSIRDGKKTVTKAQDSKVLEAEVQWKEELEKALAQEVNKTIDERKEEGNQV